MGQTALGKDSTSGYRKIVRRGPRSIPLERAAEEYKKKYPARTWPDIINPQSNFIRKSKLDEVNKPQFITPVRIDVTFFDKMCFGLDMVPPFFK